MIDHSWYKRPPHISESVSAGGVVVRLESSQIYVALVQAREKQEYFLPKGHVEPEESIQDAACREIEEEAGLKDLKLIENLGVRERLSFKKREWKKIHYFLFLTEQVEGKPTDPHVRYVLGWFPLEKLPPLFWPEQQELIEINRNLIISSVSS